MASDRAKEHMRRAVFPLTALAMHALAAFAVVRFAPEHFAVEKPLDEATRATSTDPNADDSVEVTIEPSLAIPNTPLSMRTGGAAEADRDRVAVREHAATLDSSGVPDPTGAVAAHEPSRDQDAPRVAEKVQDAPTSHDEPSPAPASSSGIVTFGARPPVDVGLARGEALAWAHSAVGEHPSGTGASDPSGPSGPSDASSRAVQESLRDGLRRRDEALGLGPEGPVRVALAEGTSRSIAPVRGRATFTVVTNAAGVVTGIELLDTDGERSGWADAARVAFAELKDKKLSLPPGAKSASMTIEVTSAWKLPNGQDPGTEVSLFGRTVSKGEGKDAAKVTILDPVPKIRMTNIAIGSGEPILVPTVQIDLFQTSFDPSNVGAKPRRIIHTRVIDTRYM